MIQFAGLLVVMSALFAVMGYLRGFTQELLGTAGIIAALFGLFYFDPLIRTVLVGLTPENLFLLQTLIFVVVVYLAYENRSGIGRDDGRGRGDRRGDDRRDQLQSNVLGGLLGAVNGYLIWGTLWYFLDVNRYPFAPFVMAPAPGSISEEWIGALPLVILGSGAGGNGLLLVVLVLVVLVVLLAAL